MDVEPWWRAVVELIAFLELSPEEAVDEDSTVAVMEEVAARLGELSASDTRAFTQFCRQFAADERRRGAARERVHFIESLPTTLGLDRA